MELPEDDTLSPSERWMRFFLWIDNEFEKQRKSGEIKGDAWDDDDDDDFF